MWPKRVELKVFLTESFMEDSAPNPETIKRNIKTGQIPGEVVGRKYYVWVGPNYQLMSPGESAADALANSLLAEWESEYGEDQAA